MSIIILQGKEEKAQRIHYEVDSSLPALGEGGMGQVRRGVRVDEKTGLKSDVAIKFLFEDLSEKAIARARREASVRIHNENLVEMFGFVEVVGITKKVDVAGCASHGSRVERGEGLTFDAFYDFVRPLHLDYLIMGQHFVGNEYDEGSYYAAIEGKKEDYLSQYVRQVKEGLRKGVFTYLAHPDIVWYSGDPGYYTLKMTELCLFARERDIPLEFNLLGYLNGRSYPTPAFWDIVARVGNKVVIGYDAHSPEALLQSDAAQHCLGLLAAKGITPVSIEEITLRNEKL